jgi:transcriptional regulator with XRE-family HTH domain
MNDFTIPDRTIDWKELVRSILASGLTQTELAVAVGCSQAHISDLLRGVRGKRVGFPLAIKLLELQQQRSAKAISDSPEATPSDRN